MHTPIASVISICLVLSLCLVSGSSVMVIVFEQSDRTVLIPEAIIYADGNIAGKTDLNGAFNLSFDGFNPSIRVAKGGYTDWMGSPADNDTAILAPMQVRNSTLHVEAFDADTLIPVQDAHIVVTSEDGVKHEDRSGFNGKTDLALRADQVYTLKIDAPDFQAVHDTIVTGGDSSTVQYALVRNDRISIRVTDSPGGFPIPSAHVQIDGATAGITNDRGVLISNTSRNVEHVFDISGEGYDPAHLVRTISFEDQVIDIPLVKAKTTVFVSVYDKDQKPVASALVRMDGELQGETNEYGRLMLTSLEMKSYEFSITHEGYKKNTLIYTPGKETGELIIALESELIDLVVFVSDSFGVPLSSVSVSLLGESQETMNTNETGIDGISILPAVETNSYRLKAEKGGYYPNMSSVNTQNNPNIVILHTPATANSGSSGQFPWTFVGIGLFVFILAGAGFVAFISKRKQPRRKSRSNRKRSL